MHSRASRAASMSWWASTGRRELGIAPAASKWCVSGRISGTLASVFREEFDGPGLDTSVWLPHYLPAWSSRAETAAAYEVADSCLRLFIPPGQGLWMGPEHEHPLRVSGVQTGNFSGPVGSRTG